ncbi:MAG TPA: 1-acyl-sn-glycerol-3-phosphate acyltransferase [Polyangiaceae bacterium]|nr:1-acyl-sn-glycerol-3-phosphate acyltransferase [Polyangiaceae bacterium]
MTAERELTRTYEPNPVLRAIYQRFFDKIQVDEAWVREVQALSERGSIVYVLRSLNFIDFFALDYLTKRYKLPQVRFVNDLGLWILNPMGKGWLNAILPRPNVSQSDELEDALSRGGSAALFLKRPPGVIDVATGASGGRGLKEGDELVRTLFELQRKREKPIFVVPQVFVWTKFPNTRGTEPLDFILGPREWPSPARTAAQLLHNFRYVELKLGEPVDLSIFLQEPGVDSDAVRLRRLTYMVLGRLERERRAVIGPAEKAPERVRNELLRNPRLRNVIDDLVDDRNDRHTLVKRAHEMLRELQATPDRSWIKALEVVFNRVFTRIYAGIEYEKSDIERLRAAAREGTLILLPSHKSHVDYLILSYIFNEQNLPLPLIAAGDNLNFFPAGAVFRRGGAFFIRRSFRGDRLYAAVVDAYVRRLIRDGYPIELFMEGGRSRTGKLVAPKFGMLNMVVDAALSVPEKPSFFVPVSIGYERVIEAPSYERELQGGEKTKEDAAGLLKTSDVLRHRYGRINMQVGQVLSLEELRREVGAENGQTLSPAKRRSLVTRLGNRVMDEINRVTSITPGALTAMVLLSHKQRGLPHRELLQRAERLLSVAQRQGARSSPALTSGGGRLRPGSIREAVQMFVDADLVEVHYPDDPAVKGQPGEHASYVVTPARRLLLDVSKNIIVHFFVERGLVASALLAAPQRTESTLWVRDRVQALSRLFKFEFRFRADRPFERIFDETLANMLQDGELLHENGALSIGPGRDGWSGHDWLSLYSAVLRNFLEGYWVAARSLAELVRAPLADKELLKRAIALGNRAFLAGELERSEAVSKSILQNAFQAFVDHGFLSLRDNKLDLTDNLASEQGARQVADRLKTFIPEGA